MRASLISVCLTLSRHTSGKRTEYRVLGGWEREKHEEAKNTHLSRSNTRTHSPDSLALTHSLSLSLSSLLPLIICLSQWLCCSLLSRKRSSSSGGRGGWRGACFFLCREKREGLCIPLYHIYDLLPLTERESRSRTLTPD